MKYIRLTKAQFESLSQEFITFLATQSITVDEWKMINEESPNMAEEELDLFSDLVWEKVLGTANYLENIAPNQLFLFQLGEQKMTLISLKIKDAHIDITTEKGYIWIQENFTSDKVEFYTANKYYSEDKFNDIFILIQQGAVLTKGDLFNYFHSLMQ